MEEVARVVLVIGAIVLLVANLIPRGAGRDLLIWLGAVFVFLGIVGTIIGLIVGDRSGKRGRKRPDKHYGVR